MVREAYALLRQSIIHVEQDDIDFEDDADETLPAPGEGANGTTPDTNRDSDFDMADIAAAEAAEASYNASSLLNGDSSTAAMTSERDRRFGSDGPSSTPVPARKKLRITCEQHLGRLQSGMVAYWPTLHRQQIYGHHELMVSADSNCNPTCSCTETTLSLAFFT